MESSLQPDNAVSLGDYVAALKRRRFLAVGIALPIVVLGLVMALALPDVYRSTATFRLVSDRIAETTADRSEYADQYVFGLAEKVFSSDISETIVRDLRPYPSIADGDEGQAFRRLRNATKVAMVTQTILEPGGGRERVVNTGFTVSFESHSPEMAEKVAQTLARAFIDMGRADQLSVATNKVSFFASEAERLSAEIAAFEKRLSVFKAENFDRLPESAQASVAIRARFEQELEGVEREIRAAQQNRVFVAQQLRQAQAGPSAGNLRQLEDEYARKSAVYAETHPDMVALRRQIENVKRGGTVATGNTLQAQLEQQQAVLAEARQRYNEDHPDVRRLVRNIELLQSRIASGEGSPVGSSDTLMSMQLQTQLNALDTQVAGLQARGGMIRARLVQLEEQLGSTPEVEREYQEITRGLGTAREQYDQMIAKRLDGDLEVAAINTGAADRFMLFAPASVPMSPSGPPRMGLVIVSLLLAAVTAMAAVAVAESIDTTVRGSRDVRGLMGRTPLAVVPRIHNSVYFQQRKRRLVLIVGSLLIGAPVLYLVVRLAAA